MSTPTQEPSRTIIAEALRKIDDLTTRLQIAEQASTEPIAVVGMGCRFPGGVNNPDQYWDLLTQGRSGIVGVPAQRWDAEAFYDPDPLTPGRMTTKWGGFVSDVAGFDADFFGITPREATAMDPQHRMLLEVSWEALEHAEINPASLRGRDVGVFTGVFANNYAGHGPVNKELDGYLGTGNATSDPPPASTTIRRFCAFTRASDALIAG